MNIYSEEVARFLDRCYESGIKDPVRFMVDKFPRLYGELRGAFPRGILPTDVDGEVELSGQFLRFEFKHEDALRNGYVPKGQLRCIQALVATGKFTVFVVGHDQTGAPTLCHIYSKRYPTNPKLIDPFDNTQLRQLCATWSDLVQKKPLRTKESPGT